jgi:colicin import membrane protein
VADADRRAADAREAEAAADRRAAEARADGERSRADALRERLETMQAQLAMAEAESKAAHDRAGVSGDQQAAAERRAAADRERADRAEASAAHERQDFLDVEILTRRELDTLRERLAEAEKGREVAEAAVLQAAQTADETLQTAAARRRLGLAARLRAAWRGD